MSSPKVHVEVNHSLYYLMNSEEIKEGLMNLLLAFIIFSRRLNYWTGPIVWLSTQKNRRTRRNKSV